MAICGVLHSNPYLFSRVAEKTTANKQSGGQKGLFLKRHYRLNLILRLGGILSYLEKNFVYVPDSVNVGEDA